jgi:hypothetical protein
MDCRRDLGIYVEAIQKVFHRLKQIVKCIVVIAEALDRLIGSDVTKMRAWGLKKDTYRK